MNVLVKAGTRLRAGTAEVIVVRAPQWPVELACDGEPLRQPEGEVPSSTAGEATLQMGKRYVDESAGIELLCTRAGVGTLSCDGRAMLVKGAKPLPSSD